jgi:hypothetical protein
MVLADRVKPAHVAEFAEHLAKKYGLQYVFAGGADALSLVFAAARMIVSREKPEEFLRDHALTVGNLLCLPFETRDPAPLGRWTLPEQIMALAQAATHALQSANHWTAPLSWDYFSDERARGRYETEAARVIWELHPLMYAGLRVDPYKLTARLADYGCSDATVLEAQKQLLEHIDQAERRGKITRTGHDAIVWLADHVY